MITLTEQEYDRLKVMLYHAVSSRDVVEAMAALRAQYLTLAVQVLRGGADSRSTSLALTQLEASLMRAIQALALQGEAVVPEGFAREEAPDLREALTLSDLATQPGRTSAPYTHAHESLVYRTKESR